MQEGGDLDLLFLKENAEAFQYSEGVREWSGLEASTSYSLE